MKKRVQGSDGLDEPTLGDQMVVGEIHMTGSWKWGTHTTIIPTLSTVSGVEDGRKKNSNSKLKKKSFWSFHPPFWLNTVSIQIYLASVTTYNSDGPIGR